MWVISHKCPKNIDKPSRFSLVDKKNEDYSILLTHKWCTGDVAMACCGSQWLALQCRFARSHGYRSKVCRCLIWQFDHPVGVHFIWPRPTEKKAREKGVEFRKHSSSSLLRINIWGLVKTSTIIFWGMNIHIPTLSAPWSQGIEPPGGTRCLGRVQARRHWNAGGYLAVWSQLLTGSWEFCSFSQKPIFSVFRMCHLWSRYNLV